jgi:hypothetical protein
MERGRSQEANVVPLSAPYGFGCCKQSDVLLRQRGTSQVMPPTDKQSAIFNGGYVLLH